MPLLKIRYIVVSVLCDVGVYNESHIGLGMLSWQQVVESWIMKKQGGNILVGRFLVSSF